VGFGVFYNQPFQWDYSTGTVLMVNPLTPSTVGGNNQSWLFLTSMNRAGKGVEAFPVYFGQNLVGYQVFDWSRAFEPNDSPWAVGLPNSSLSSYIYSIPLSNDGWNTFEQFPSLGLVNQTYLLHDTTWVNEVYLLNPGNNTFDLIYSHTYSALITEQHDSFFGHWGPIIETFQAQYNNTNKLGFAYAQVSTIISACCYGSFYPLGIDNSSIENDNQGFVTWFFDPNWTFVVH
jgi:hypothetical protein